VLRPGNRIVRQLPRLAGPGQFSQRCVQTELEKLLNAQHHRAAADMMVPRNGFIAVRRFSAVRDLRRDSSLITSCSLNWRGLRFLGKGITH